MDSDLGSFEGRPVQIGTATISASTHARVGKIDGNEEVIVICKARPKDVAFGDVTVAKTKLFARKHALGGSRMIVLPFEEGVRLLEEAITLADDTFGIQSLLSEIAATGGADADDPGTDENNNSEDEIE